MRKKRLEWVELRIVAHPLVSVSLEAVEWEIG